jgi:regulator of sigma E protease
VSLAVGSLRPAEADAELMNKIGILRPWTDTAIGEVLPDGAAAAAGVRQGDVVLKVDGADVPDGHDLRQRIRQSVTKSGEGVAQQWLIERQGKKLPVTVTPWPEQLNGVWVGRVGAFIGHPPETVLIRKGPLDGVSAAVAKTWDVSILSLNMMGKMVLGEASLKNLTGPLTIADYAGKSASIGLTAYLSFLALISVSLGVLNLLPLPVLDGGHLMYYLWEGVTGRPISELWQDRFQRGGIVILMAMMSIALFNDVTRLMG